MTLDSTPLTPIPGFDLTHYPPKAGTPCTAADVRATQQKTVDALAQFYADLYLGGGTKTPFRVENDVASIKSLTGIVDGETLILLDSSNKPHSIWRYMLGVAGSDHINQIGSSDLSGVWYRVGLSDFSVDHIGTASTDPLQYVFGLCSTSGRSYNTNFGAQTVCGIGALGSTALTNVLTSVLDVSPSGFDDQLKTGDIVSAEFNVNSSLTYSSGSPARCTMEFSIDLINSSASVVASRTFMESRDVSSSWTSPQMSVVVDLRKTFAMAAGSNSITARLKARKIDVSGSTAVSITAEGIVRVGRP